MWMFLVLIYGLLKGAREIVKKKSLQRSSVIEVLFFYTLFAFLFVCADAPNAAGVDPKHMGFIVIKSFIVFLAWIFSFKAIKKMPISLYGILDLSRVLFATLLAIVVLHETLELPQIVGLILVSAGLLLLKRPGQKEKTETDNAEKVPTILVLFALASCMLNALSGLLDKILMSDITSSQLQFWYMLFLVLFYLLYIVFTRQKIQWKQSLLNPWIWLLAFLFVVADRSLFLANADPDSRINIMTLIKQSGCIVTILAGKYIFHEKNIGYKLFCACIIIAGIVISVL